MDPEVMDVKMFPKSEVPARSSSLQNSEASSQSSEQAPVRTSAIPLPEGQLRNRNVGTETKALPEVPEKQDVDRSSTTSSIDDSQPPNPDLVLLFNTPKPDAPAQETTAAQKEFARLLKCLNEAGLLTSSAPATEGTHQRLVFIKGVQSAIRAEAQKERFADWLRTLRLGASREDLNSPRDFQQEPLAPAERIRLAAKILEAVLYSSPQNISALQAHEPYHHIASYFPLHDEKFNNQWLKQWSQFQLVIPDSQLADIKDHFGEDVALYFDFLRYYFRALAFPAFVGLSSWLGGHYFSRLYSFCLVLWSVAFVESWRIRERKLSVRWGTLGLSEDQVDVRPGFRPEEIITSPITGQKVAHSPWWKREGRMLAGVPALVGFAGALTVLICCIFSAEVIINEVYNGPGKQFISLLPLVGYAGVVPQVVTLWHEIARQLTDWENHPTRTGYVRAQTLKMFALNAIVSYGVLTLTAYVYLPFASFVVPFLTHKLGNSVPNDSAYAKSFNQGAQFSFNPHRLTNTLFALMTTTQAIGAFTEVVLPFLQKKISQQYQEHAKKTDASKHSPSNTWLDRVREQSSRPAMELFSEYAEMVIQFGHVVLFSTAWPLAPVAALINNFLELRGDAFKLCTNMRRPIPARADSIGPWLDALSFICYLSALTNASLVYLMRPFTPAQVKSTAVETVQGMLQAVGNATHIKTLPAGSNTPFTTTRLEQGQGDYPLVLQTLLAALLCALASEHAFSLVRSAAKHLLERMIWEGSEEEAYTRGLNWQLRRDYIKSRGGELFEAEITRLANRQQQDLEAIQAGTMENSQLPSMQFWQTDKSGSESYTGGNKKSQ